MCVTSPTPVRSPSPQQIESKVQILVEGRDLKGFCEGLVHHLALKNLQIQDFGGIDQLETFLPALIKMPDFSSVTSVGIVRDAEKNAASAFASVRGCLKHAGLPVPGTVGQRAGIHPAVTVMVLPGNNRDGMLETLLCETFANEDVHTCIDSFFECVEKLQGKPVHRPEKARARAYLATKHDPHLSVGVAAKRGYWNLDHPVLQPLCVFLRNIA